MNPNFNHRMYTGSPYKAYLGIRGIQATIRGESAFHSFADSLDAETGETSSRVHLPATSTMPQNGLLVYSDCILFFSSGAQNAGHVEMVTLGIADTYNHPNNPLFNIRVLAAVTSRWGASVSQWHRDIRRCYVFGHSYGSVVADCFCYQFSSLKPDVRFLCETYGGPRSCIPSRAPARLDWERKRNVHLLDVVSHIPFNEDEAPLAASITPARYKNGFNRAGHVCNAEVYDYDGNSTEIENNVIPVQDTTLSMIAWFTYAQHLAGRQHELETYLNTMARAAVGVDYGTLPPADVTTIPGPTMQPTPPLIGGLVQGPIPTPADVAHQLAIDEANAASAYERAETKKPARAVRRHGVAGVEFMGAVRVVASSPRAAGNLSKRLNKLRRILGPVTNAQRDQLIEAVRMDLESVEMAL